MTSAQDQTLDQYQALMQINASAHLLRAAREIGILDELRQGQRTVSQLCEALNLAMRPTSLLLDALVAIQIVEKYHDDYALSRAAHLLCQYDQDLGDSRWQRLTQRVRGITPRSDHDDRRQHHHSAATQWIHTPAAMQAAEILDVGGEGETVGLKILDLGCGSAVWSCAMAHRDPAAEVTAVDTPEALVAAKATADSIELGDRFAMLPSDDPRHAELPADAFDLVVIAQRLHCLSGDAATQLLATAVAATKPGGRVVVIDLFRSPGRANLSETLEALKLDLDTQTGAMRTLAESQTEMQNAGLQRVQFTFLAASRVNLGLAVGHKNGSDD